MARLHPTVQALLAEVEAYRVRSGTDRTRFGLEAVNDGNFITRLEHGRLPTIRTIERVRAFIDRNSKAVKPRKKAS
jgi:hypothetical protein